MIKKITTFALGLLLTAGLWAQVSNNDLHRHEAGGDGRDADTRRGGGDRWAGEDCVAVAQHLPRGGCGATARLGDIRYVRL